MAGTRPSDWRYVSEGGATIVFSYTGPPSPIFNNRVLRLRKSLLLTNNTDELDDSMVDFQRRCTSRLIPPVHLPRLDFVSLDKEWINDFVSLHDAARPEERRSKGSIDATRTKAVLATDLVGGDWIAVEIKPKWAFLPSPKYLSSETCLAKTKTCRFCMHSRVRASQGEIQAVGYCPLDLFSGEEHRMRHGISSLWDAWMMSDGAINNLKIFVGGKLIQPNEASSMWVHGDDFRNRDIKEEFTSALLPLLLHTPALQRISHLQRTLDTFDIEGLSRIWHGTEFNGQLFQEPTMAEWDEFVGKFLGSEVSHLDHIELEPSNYRYCLLAYLLSATFKDCSLILRLDYLGSRLSDRVDRERVSIIDLDIKSTSRLRKWERMDKDIVEGYTKLGEDRICVDYRP